MWFTTGSIGVRILLAIASILLNGRLLQLILRCFRKNDENIYKIFCLLYSAIPFVFMLFSALELITLNINITGTYNFNLVGFCNFFHVQNCGLYYGWQIGCFIHNLLVLPLLFYFRQKIVSDDKLEEEFDRSPCMFFKIFCSWFCVFALGLIFGAMFNDAQLKLDAVPIEPELRKSPVSFMFHGMNAPFDLKFGPDFFGYQIHLILGIIWAPAYMISWTYYKMIPFKPRLVAKGINVEAEWRLARALLLGLASTSIWPLIYLLYNVPLVILQFPGVPLDLVMVSINIVPVVFALLQYRYVHGELALVHILPRSESRNPYLGSEERSTGTASNPVYFDLKDAFNTRAIVQGVR